MFTVLTIDKQHGRVSDGMLKRSSISFEMTLFCFHVSIPSCLNAHVHTLTSTHVHVHL